MCHKWRSYDVWLLRYKTGHIFSLLLLFYPDNPENQNFEKMKKKNGEISSFHTSILKTIIICYTVLQIWCMTDVTVIFHFGLFFVLSTPTPNSPKIPYQKKEEKKHLEISSFYTSVPKIMIRLCTAPEIRCVTDKHTGR